MESIINSIINSESNKVKIEIVKIEDLEEFGKNISRELNLIIHRIKQNLFIFETEEKFIIISSILENDEYNFNISFIMKERIYLNDDMEDISTDDYYTDEESDIEMN